MTTKEELKEMIGDLYEQAKKIDISTEILRDDIGILNDAVNNLEPEQQYGRWKPKKGEIYYYNTDDGRTFTVYWCDSYGDNFRYSTGNCYKTSEQAEQAPERLKIRTQLEDIALRLNKGKSVDFNSYENKYFLNYDVDADMICYSSFIGYRNEGTIYCLDKNFKDVAIKEIGKERLAKYLKGE